MKNLAVALLLLLTPFLAFGQSGLPGLKITGAETEIPPGELVILTANLDGPKPENVVDVKYTWKIYDGNKEKLRVRQIDNTVDFGVGVYKKSLLATVSASFLIKDGEKYTISNPVVASVEVNTPGIGPAPPPGPEPPPGPGPGPGPTPNPDPVLPDGVFRLAPDTYKFAKDNKLNPKAASLMMSTYTGVSSSLAAGAFDQYKDKNTFVKAIFAQILQENHEKFRQAGLSTDTPDVQGYAKAWSDKVFSLYKEQKLVDKSTYITAFSETVMGLSAYIGSKAVEGQ